MIRFQDILRFFVIVMSLSLVGCGVLLPKNPAVDISTKVASLSQRGNAKTPASITETGVDIPAGSKITIETTRNGKANTSQIVGPTSFSPPSLIEQAKAAGIKWFYIAGVLLALAGVASVALSHPITGVICFGGAVGMPIIGNLVSSISIPFLCVVIALVVGLQIAWHKFKPELTELWASKAPK